MASKKEYELAIKIAGMVDQSLESSCNITKKQLRSIAREAANASGGNAAFAAAWKKAGSGIDSSWNGAKKIVTTTADAMLAAGAAMTLVGGLAINAGSDFESAFAGVRKTVNATEEEFTVLEEAIRNMAKNKPQTAMELDEIAEAAGQLGIQTENLESFTSVMADLKEATNLGDEGASQFAKFANIVGMQQDKFSNLGSAVVALGNTSATTEADIMEMAMNIAGAGNQVNMSEGDILGFSASLSSVGIEAEKGGSAMSKLMVNMQLATENGGESLSQFAAVAGMSASDFKQAFKKDAAGAIIAFISGLNDTGRLGKSAIATLDDMGIREVRLRDTLLRAANASGLFVDTLATGNAAFDENVALTKEAEQRYATFESRLGMVKNRINDVGISLYQDFRDPLSDCLDIALNFTDQAGIFDSQSIKQMAKDFQRSIPTVVRNLEDAKDSFLEFANPVIKIGGWMVDNPDIIAGGLAAIGTTIASLKLAKTITDTASAMNALKVAMMSNPLTAAIGIAALAGGALVGLSAKIKIANAELKKQNLQEHFGNISLSIGELEDAATQIIDNGSLTKLGTAMSELDKVKNIAKDLLGSQESLNKINWKVEMGFELSETDMELYGRELDSYIKNSIAIGEQKQYTMNLSLKLLTDDDETGQGIIDQFNAFYDGLNLELRGYGKELGEVYAEGMEDGVLSMDEIETIQALQAKMAEITAKLSNSQFEAKMETIGIKYGGGQLDADSFKNLQAEIQEQVDLASASLQEALIMNIAGAKIQLEDGAIDATEYETMVSEFKENYLEQIGEIQLKASSFQTDTLYQQYGEELNKILPQLNEFIGTRMSDYFATAKMGGNADLSFSGFMSGFKDGLSRDSKAAIEELWNSMSPDLERLEGIKLAYLAAGRAVPEELAKAISDSAALGIVSGSQDALWSYINVGATANEQYQQTIQTMKDCGYAIPEEIASGLSSNTGAIESEISSMYSLTNTLFQEKFSKFNVNSKLNLDFTITGNGKPVQIPGGTAHADGGIFNEPHFGVFGEAGKEAFIPIDRSRRSRSIWEQTGEELGMFSNNVTNSSQSSDDSRITYAPVYHVSGGNEESVRRATSNDYERFEAFMRQYERTNKRLAF